MGTQIEASTAAYVLPPLSRPPETRNVICWAFTTCQAQQPQVVKNCYPYPRFQIRPAQWWGAGLQPGTWAGQTGSVNVCRVSVKELSLAWDLGMFTKGINFPKSKLFQVPRKGCLVPAPWPPLKSSCPSENFVGHREGQARAGLSVLYS